MSHQSPEISAFLLERIAANDFPSAVYLVAEKDEIVFQDAVGYAVIEPEQIEARPDTIYDLASLTKVLVTGLLCARLVEARDLDTAAPIGRYLTEFTGSDKDHVTIGDLLRHASGFAAWKPFYLLVNESREIAANVAFTPFEYKTGSKVVYSDANFILLARIVEHVRKCSLREILDSDIVSRLGLQDTSFRFDGRSRECVAASEKGNEFEKQTCVDLGFLRPEEAKISHKFRDYQIWGEIHDGNAYFMGGVAGHAGLFSTAEEVFKIAQQFLQNYSKLLKPETCELFRTNFTPGMNEHRSFAFQLASTPDSTAGTKMSPESFGHLGFTGTSLWIDPVKERVFILLTNRTHHHELPFVNINSVRRRFHDLAIEALEKK